MTREERENALHCLKVMIGEEVCEECNLYGTTGTDHCEADCVRVAIQSLEQEKIGHWIYTLEDWNRWECSECGYTKRTDIHVSLGYNYCPKCGCRMSEVEK